MKVYVNGQQVCSCEVVLGPVCLTVNLLNQLDEITDTSYRELNRSAVIRGMSNKETTTVLTTVTSVTGIVCSQLLKGDTVVKLHAFHATTILIQNEIDRHLHVLQTTKISSGERQERENVGDGTGVDVEESLLVPTPLVLRKSERGGGIDSGRKEGGVKVSSGEKARDMGRMTDTVKRIRKEARDLSLMMCRIDKLENQRSPEEPLMTETPAGMHQRNADLMEEVESIRV